MNIVLFYPQITTSTSSAKIPQSQYVTANPPFFTLLLPLIYYVTAITIAGAHSEEDQRAAYLYGTYVGQAFQLVDDALDFEGKILHLALGTFAVADAAAVAIAVAVAVCVVVAACVWYIST